ncbi:TPA: VWA domain-containing protein [Candidatus Woesearchaeota archaeon]|nr:VWA domain-containing protein [Candidatus Woesearchaeota archaeon]HII65956.1 VWA domain-containing protein [Candidatus Woesearchaeota archaeon]
MVAFDSPAAVEKLERIEEADGKLSSQDEERKLMHSVLENDKASLDAGKLINESFNRGLSSFTPDMMFAQMVKNYSIAKQIYGETLIKLASGYNPDYIRKNIGIPEFRKELRQRIAQTHQELEHQGLVTGEGNFSEQGVTLASLVLYTEELDHLISHGLAGEKANKEKFLYGAREGVKEFRKGDRYRDIALRKSLKKAIRRSHRTLAPEDLQSFEKESRGKACIIYALDASGSMKGKKLEACKKAGIALAYKAISEKDNVGLMVFGSDVKETVEPTQDFMRLLLAITKAKASRETDIAATLQKAIELFPSGEMTKHLILITDALPTKGAEPEKLTLEGASKARNAGITVSVIGISLDERGKELAQKVSTIGNGRLWVVGESDNYDQIVLQEYHAI